MTIRTLHDLFILALEDVLYAETLFARKLPVMAAAAGNRQLRALLESSQEARVHLARLRTVFHAIDEPAVPRRSQRAWGFAEEAASASELTHHDIRDAALLAGLLAVKQYEIGRYAALVAWADEMAHEEAASLLRSTLFETKAAEHVLRRLAQTWIGGAAIAA